MCSDHLPAERAKAQHAAEQHVNRLYDVVALQCVIGEWVGEADEPGHQTLRLLQMLMGLEMAT